MRRAVAGQVKRLGEDDQGEMGRGEAAKSKRLGRCINDWRRRCGLVFCIYSILQAGVDLAL